MQLLGKMSYLGTIGHWQILLNKRAHDVKGQTKHCTQISTLSIKKKGYYINTFKKYIPQNNWTQAWTGRGWSTTQI